MVDTSGGGWNDPELSQNGDGGDQRLDLVVIKSGDLHRIEVQQHRHPGAAIRPNRRALLMLAVTAAAARPCESA